MLKKIKFTAVYGIGQKFAIERLTALWALNECALGGIMHALKLPFTGIVVGGISVLLITLIALYSTKLWSTLLKSLTIVLLLKAAVSPYTPITAYFAVSFQAFSGLFLYSLFSVNKLTVVFLCLLTFLESALQKLITLTLIFGHSLWTAIDVYMGWIGHQFSFLPSTLSSNVLIYIFLGSYAISGIIVAFLIIRTIKSIGLVTGSQTYFDRNVSLPPKSSKKKNKHRRFGFFILLMVVLIPILYYNNNAQGWQKAAYLISRSLLTLVLWYTLIGPLLLKILNKFLSKKRSHYHTDLEQALQLFPSLKVIIYAAWKECKSLHGWNRWSQFLAKSIAYSLQFNTIRE